MTFSCCAFHTRICINIVQIIVSDVIGGLLWGTCAEFSFDSSKDFMGFELAFHVPDINKTVLTGTCFILLCTTMYYFVLLCRTKKYDKVRTGPKKE